MSYQDLARSGAPASSHHAGVPFLPQGIAGGTRTVEQLLLKLANSISSLKKLVDALGGPKDTVDHRHRVAETNTSIQELAKQIKEQLTVAMEHHLGGPEQQQKNKKLLQDFTALLQDYKATQKIAADREAASLPKPGSRKLGGAAAGTSWRGHGMPASGAVAIDMGGGSMGAGGGSRVEADIEKQALLQAQQAKEAARLDDAITFNESLIEERDAGIRDIVRQIGEVNEMFQDLAVLVNDQGVQLLTVDDQITATAERAREGVRELAKAEVTQRKYRNKCLWLWLIAAIVVSIIIILLFA